MTRAQDVGRYERLSTPCCISYVTITECLMRMWPSKIYTISCGATAFYDAKTQMQLDWQNRSPFSPVVNIVRDDLLEPHEWYLSAPDDADRSGRSIGSEGL